MRFLHLLDDQAADWSGVGAADRVAVRNQLLALQRVLHLSDDPETAMVLLSAGLDSSVDIIDLDYAECFVSDESSLADFHTELSDEHLHERILLAYGVDVSDIEDGRLVRIFERLVASGASA